MSQTFLGRNNLYFYVTGGHDTIAVVQFYAVDAVARSGYPVYFRIQEGDISRVSINYECETIQFRIVGDIGNQTVDLELQHLGDELAGKCSCDRSGIAIEFVLYDERIKSKRINFYALEELVLLIQPS